MPPGPPLGGFDSGAAGSGVRPRGPAAPHGLTPPEKGRGTGDAAEGNQHLPAHRTFPLPAPAVRGPCGPPWSVFSPHSRCPGPGLVPFARRPRGSPAPVPREAAQASGCLCAGHTTGGKRGTPANHPAAEQPAAPYKQLLCESHSNCSVSRRSSGREQKPCQGPGPGEAGDGSEVGRTWPRHLLDDTASGALSAPLHSGCALFPSYRCLELAHSSTDN